MPYLRGNWRRTASQTIVPYAWGGSAMAAPGAIFVSGATVWIFRTATTFVNIAVDASSSIADL